VVPLVASRALVASSTYKTRTILLQRVHLLFLHATLFYCFSNSIKANKILHKEDRGLAGHKGQTAKFSKRKA
jgi:hypothetical protein